VKLKIASINVSLPREVEFEGKVVSSGIWKEAVKGPVKVGDTQLAGDRQANPMLHGGIHKAVYAYSLDHYAWWENELQRKDLSPGMFGENLTVEGLDETESRVGDVWEAGEVKFVITGPRIPCSKLAMKFGDKSMPRRFTEAGLPGVYLRVLETGQLMTGQSMDLATRGDGVTVHSLYRAYTRPRNEGSPETLQLALTNPWLDPDMVHNIKKRLKN
jgi:MOSC domain-containing protein YiiM